MLGNSHYGEADSGEGTAPAHNCPLAFLHSLKRRGQSTRLLAGHTGRTARKASYPRPASAVRQCQEKIGHVSRRCSGALPVG
jgi:hypothetical protein